MHSAFTRLISPAGRAFDYVDEAVAEDWKVCPANGVAPCFRLVYLVQVV